MTNDKNLNGIRGWLILIGIMIVLSPMVHTYKFYSIYSAIFTTDTWANLSAIGSTEYNPARKPIIVLGFILNTIMVLIEVIIAILFFSHHKAFPKLYIGMLIYSFFILILDPLSAYYLLPNVKIDITSFYKPIIKSVLYMLILIPYMLRSERVKATFVNSGITIKLSRTEKSLHKPEGIRQAILALWITIGISVLTAVFDVLLGYMSTGAFIGQLIFSTLFCLFIYKINNGSNLTRYVYAVITILSYIFISFVTDELSTVEVISAIISTPIECFIIFRLFQKEASTWFMMKSPVSPEYEELEMLQQPTKSGTHD